MAENEVLDRAKFHVPIPEIVRNEFKSRCVFDRVSMGEVVERLLREYLASSVGIAKPPDRCDSSSLVPLAVQIDRVVRNEFKSRCAIEQEGMARVVSRILQEYLATTAD